MTSMTSAYANKILRQLDDEKNFLETQERSSCTYVAADGEEPTIPEYDFETVNSRIAKVDEKIQKIKHAINVANTTQTITVNSKDYTIDAILVRMSQLNKRKSTLDMMRKKQPKVRRSGGYLSDRKTVEYEYANFDPELAKAEFQKISSEIMNIQLALDKHNQTFVFEVDVDL